MGSALCGGGEMWPPLPPELQEQYDAWVAAGRPGAEELAEVADDDGEEDDDGGG